MHVRPHRDSGTPPDVTLTRGEADKGGYLPPAPHMGGFHIWSGALGALARNLNSVLKPKKKSFEFSSYATTFKKLRNSSCGHQVSELVSSQSPR